MADTATRATRPGGVEIASETPLWEAKVTPHLQPDAEVTPHRARDRSRSATQRTHELRADIVHRRDLSTTPGNPATTMPDPCAPPVGTYGVDYGPNGHSQDGFLDCIPGSGRFPSLNGSAHANRTSPFMAAFYNYVDHALNSAQEIPNKPSQQSP